MRTESMLVAYIFVLTGFMVAALFTQALQKAVFDDSYHLPVVNAEDLVNSGDFVGYQRDSVVEVILKQLNFQESQLRVYNSPEEYDQALRRGSKHGGVSAVFDELPYIKLFLNKHPGKYRRVEPIYRMEGFGFAFPRGSPLVTDVSRAILSVVEGENIVKIEKAWLGSERTFPGPLKKTPSGHFTIYNTWGIFVIALILIFLLYTVSRLAHAIRQSENKFFKGLRSFFHAEPPPDDTIIPNSESAADADGSGNVACSLQAAAESSELERPSSSVELTNLSTEPSVPESEVAVATNQLDQVIDVS